MRSLLNFLMRFSSVIVFAFYVILSLVLLFDRNPYHHHVYMTSAGAVASAVYKQTNAVTSYFHLHDINEDLQRRNASLEAEVIALRHQLRQYEEVIYADSMTVPEALHPYSFIIAHVINNSISKPYNYITIEKGAQDGVKPEMGVVDQNGVVGVVNVTGPHSSRIISLLNPNFRLSCRVKGSDSFGSLVWDGRTYEEAILEELPKHTKFLPGDTIVTSGFSAVFPEGIPVGTVIGRSREGNDNFFTLRVKLLTDFSQLSTVRIIANAQLDEIIQVENENLPKEESEVN